MCTLYLDLEATKTGVFEIVGNLNTEWVSDVQWFFFLNNMRLYSRILLKKMCFTLMIHNEIFMNEMMCCLGFS